MREMSTKMSENQPEEDSKKPILVDAHIRIARPTDNIAALLPFYCQGLGFEVIGSFEDHQGFDGVMLGHPQAPYHLEFTHHRGQFPGWQSAFAGAFVSVLFA